MCACLSARFSLTGRNAAAGVHVASNSTRVRLARTLGTRERLLRLEQAKQFSWVARRVLVACSQREVKRSKLFAQSAKRLRVFEGCTDVYKTQPNAKADCLKQESQKA